MITILTTTDGCPLNKKFVMRNNVITKTAYGNAIFFHAEHRCVAGIRELSAILTELETEPLKCVIRGKVIDDPDIDPRDVLRRKHAGILSANVPLPTPAFFEDYPDGVQWVLIDFDKVDAPDWLPEDCRRQYLIEMLPSFFQNVSYHFQWSSSAGLDGWKTLSAHFWFWLSAPLSSNDLKQRSIAESWGEIDRALFNEVQVHYTAAPTFEGMLDPVGAERSGLIIRASDAVELPLFKVPTHTAASPRRASAPPANAAAMTNMARTKLSDVDESLLVDLDHSPIVSKGALDNAMNSARGGRMFRFLYAAARTALDRGYDVDAHIIEQLGQRLAQRMMRHKDGDISRGAMNALRLARENFDQVAPKRSTASGHPISQMLMPTYRMPTIA